MWYQKKQEKLLFQYMSNSMLFQFSMKITGRYQSVNFLLTHTVVLVDLNEFLSVFEKCIILTPDIRKQAQTSLESL